MRHIRVLICQVDDGTPDLMSDLACFDLATPDVATLQPETALDALEAATQETGHAILRRLLHAQWEQIDAALVARHCAQVAPAVVHQDGQETVTVASRFGLLHLRARKRITFRTILLLRRTEARGDGDGGCSSNADRSHEAPD